MSSPLEDIRCVMDQHNFIYSMMVSEITKNNGFGDINIIMSAVRCSNCGLYSKRERDCSADSHMYDLGDFIKQVDFRPKNIWLECWRHRCSHTVTREELKIFKRDRYQLIKECCV